MNEELLKAFEILQNAEYQQHPGYRFYYDEMGEIIEATVGEIETDLPSIEVTVEQYLDRTKYRINNDQLEVKGPKYERQRRLWKSENGLQVVAGHPQLVLESTDNYSDTEYYEYRTN